MLRGCYKSIIKGNKSLTLIIMGLSEVQLKILHIIAEKSARSPGRSVFDTAVINDSGLPPDEVYTYVNQLEGLGLIKIERKVAGADYRLINITKEGLDETSENQALR